MGVDLRLMRYVLAVAEEGGFGRAAERLHMAQPPLSRQIRELERRLGVTLFERRPVVRPTEAGRVFVEAARNVLADADLLVERTILAGRGELATIRMGYVPSAVHETLPSLLAAMAGRHPGVRIEARVGWPSDLDAALHRNDLDVLIFRASSRRGEHRHQLLRRERLVAVLHSGHPLAKRPALALADLKAETFHICARHLAPVHHDALLAATEAAGAGFQVRESPLPGLRHLDLSDRRSFTLMPESLAAHEPATTVGVPVTDPLPMLDMELVWKREGPALALLLAAARDLTRERDWA
jgi:DNA-binding transcriptional LysR family regulator